MNPARDRTGKSIFIQILHHAPGNVEHVSTVAVDTEAIPLTDGAIVALVGV